MIPRILHYVWVGGPLPDAQQVYVESWRRTNPDFHIMRWDESNINMSGNMIRRAYQEHKWAKVADIARLQAVLQYGGIYMDTDVELLKPLDTMLQYECFYAFQEERPSPDWVCNCVFGAVPGHWFVAQALHELYAIDRRPRLLPERPTTFGPKHVTRLLREAGLREYSPHGVMVKDVFVAPTPLFYPFHHTGQFSPECITPATLAVHYWEKSWARTIPLPVRVMKRVLKPLAWCTQRS